MSVPNGVNGVPKHREGTFLFTVSRISLVWLLLKRH